MHVDGEVADPVATLAPALQQMDDLLVLWVAAQVVVEDDLAEGGQHVELPAEVRAGHLVVDVVHAAPARQPLDRCDVALGPVVEHVLHAQATQIVALDLAAGAGDDLHALVLSQLDDRRPDTSGRPADVESLAGGGLDDLLEQSPGDEVVEGSRRRVEVHTFGQRADVVLGDCHIVGVGAVDRHVEHMHRLPDREPRHAGPQSFDDPGRLVSHGDGERGGEPLAAPGTDPPVGLADSGGLGLDQQLARSGHGLREVDVLQDFRTTELLEHHCLHCTPPQTRSWIGTAARAFAKRSRVAVSRVRH